MWLFVGTTRLNFSEAVFPEGTAKIKIFGFVNDVKLLIPEEVGMHLGSLAILSDYHGTERNEEHFFGVLEDQTENFIDAEKRVDIQINSFIAEIHVNRV